MFKVLRYFLFIYLVGFANLLFSQELEALKEDLVALKDQKQVDHYVKIAVLYAEKYGQPDSVIVYAQKAEALSRKLNYPNGILNGIIYQGIGLELMNNFDSAIKVLKRLIPQVEDRSSLHGDLLYEIGICYFRLGDKKIALNYFLDAAAIYKTANNKNGLILSYSKIADVFVSENQPIEANTYKFKTIALLPKITDPYAKILASSIISSTYLHLRRPSSNDADSSIIYSKEALKIMEEFGYYNKANKICILVSDGYFVKENYNEALIYCKEALKYRKYFLSGQIIMCYFKFGDCYTMLKQHENALVYLDSIKIAVNAINVQYYRMGYHLKYSQYHKNAGKYLEAFKGLESYMAVKDSLFNLEKSKAINELEQKYEKAENQEKISELNKKNEIASLNAKFLISGIIATIFALIIIGFFYRQSILKNNFKILETELRLNRARMDPHFFFNALSSLQSLTLKGKKHEEIAEYIHKFSKIMRESLESSYIEMITLEKEIDFLTNYLELQKLRLSNKFEYIFEVNQELEITELLVPSMIVQPFIENSIEHGFSEIKTGGLIKISFYLGNDYLNINISDNGQGFREKEGYKNYPSRATQIIKDRLLLLNKSKKSKASFEIVNQSSGDGIVVNINLPIVYKV